MAGIVVEVEGDLASLIQDDGLTPQHVQRSADVIFKAVGSTDPEQVLNVIVRALDDMEQDKYTWALRNALGVNTTRPTNLSERRAAFLEGDDFQISEATLRRWERKAMAVLARNLVLTSKYHIGEPYKFDLRAGEAASSSEDQESLLKVLTQIHEESTKQTAILQDIRGMLSAGQGEPSGGR